MAITTDETRRLLAFGEAIVLGSETDRLRYAMGTALVGTVIGGYMILARDLGSTVPRLVISGLFLGAAVGTQAWFEHSASSIPRHAKRWFGVGFVVSMAVALLVVLPLLNLRAQTESPSVVLFAAGIVAVSLPSWIAAWTIARSPINSEP